MHSPFLFFPFYCYYYYYHPSDSALVLLQRATLAEKEVTTLKEQLANNPPISGDGKDGSNNNLDRHSFENEIVAKDKEVSFVTLRVV